MYVQYGNYRHPMCGANLINFVIRPRRSPRGIQLANIVEAQVSGTIFAEEGETEYEVGAKVQELKNAFSRDGFDFGLYHSDGTPTPHIMYTNDPYNLTGNQIVHRTFPASHNGEFSTGRDFAYAVRAEYRAAETQIIDYQETIQHTGFTGPKIKWHEHKYLPAYYEVESYRTVQTIVQSGYAITNEAYLWPPEPILPLPFYLQDKTVIRRRGPRRFQRGVEGYHISWRYIFNTPAVYPALPSIR